MQESISNFSEKISVFLDKNHDIAFLIFIGVFVFLLIGNILFPIMVIAMLLVKLAIWIVKNLFKFVLWLVRTLFVLLGKGLLLAFAFVVAKKPFNHQPDR